jgi:sulfopropanediol 3-dehydrogenase
MPVTYLKAKTGTAAAAGGVDIATVQERVKEMLATIQEGKEQACKDYASKLDKYEGEVVLSKERIEKLISQISDRDKSDVDYAIEKVRTFALAQRASIKDFEQELEPGVFAGQKLIPMVTAGCYVPGGLYAHIASAVMTVATAKAAGVENVIVTTPPRPDKPGEPSFEPDALIVYAAHACGADTILCLGGVQGVGALRYGLFTGKEADILVGPGNPYVATAKRMLYGECGIDMFAGPTEIGILADATADAEVVATDLVSQAEHGPTSPVWLFTDDKALAEKVIERMPALIQFLPDRSRGAAEAAWRDYGEVILCDTKEEMCEVSDKYASEHLEVHCADLDWWLGKLKCYGSLFVGEETTVTYGDKCSGTNHVLPTKFAARYTGGLSVHKYLKCVTYQRMTREATRVLGVKAARISRCEGMEAHARAGDIRLAKYFPEEHEALLKEANAPMIEHVKKVVPTNGQ